MQTTEPESSLHFEMRDPAFQIDLLGRVQSTLFNEGSDVELGVRYLPLEPLRIESFLVDYPGTESDWKRVLREIREGEESPIDWMLATVRMRLVPAV
ncbi:MAG: hypothetical protein ACRD1Z_01085 [Vicinamibacteria bacterium]